MAYAVMRFQKHKLSTLGKIERHNNEREHLTGRVHAERQNMNIIKKAKGHENETLTQMIRKKIKEIKKTTGKTTRKDAAVVAEFVMTFSKEKEAEIMERGGEWLNANTKWLKDEFESKGAKILRMDVHFDETTVHIHAFLQMTDERGLFNASRYFEKKKQLEDLQTSYAEYMAPFGLERGKSKSETKARHISLTEFYKKDVKRLSKNIELLKLDNEAVEQKRAELKSIDEKVEKLLKQKQNEYEKIVDDIFNDDIDRNNDFDR